MEGRPYLGRVVANLLDVVGHFLDNLLITLLVILGLGGIHLVEGNNELLHSQSVGQQSMLTRLPVLGDTCAVTVWTVSIAKSKGQDSP